MGLNNKSKQIKEERLNSINFNHEGCKMKVIVYNHCSDIIVEFQDEYKAKVHTEWKHFKKGGVKNPYFPMVYEKGYIGTGKYNRKEYPEIYVMWSGMLRRCYSKEEKFKYSKYNNCYVCEEWHNFQNFAKWYEENYYEINNDFMCLDKDILYKNNKMYSPKNCIIVPNRINVLFTKSDIKRGEYPIGVTLYYDKKYGYKKLQSKCSVLNEENKKYIKHLGCFPLDRPFQAFYCYKQFKENYIKQIADEYKNLIPKELYDALYRYEVEIND